jgi:hypothetical protein
MAQVVEHLPKKTRLNHLLPTRNAPHWQKQTEA